MSRGNELCDHHTQAILKQPCWMHTYTHSHTSSSFVKGGGGGGKVMGGQHTITCNLSSKRGRGDSGKGEPNAPPV